MNPSKRIDDFEATHPDELETLWEKWRAGSFRHHAELLKDFAQKQRSSIQSFATGRTDAGALIAATKLVVVELGTVHHPTEMRDQMREIHNDIWFHGERGEHVREQIVHDWTTRYATQWRQWRLKEYLFTIDRISEELLICLSQKD